MTDLDISPEIDESKRLTIEANTVAETGQFRKAYALQGLATHEALKAVLKFQRWLESNFGGAIK